MAAYRWWGHRGAPQPVGVRRLPVHVGERAADQVRGALTTAPRTLRSECGKEMAAVVFPLMMC